MFNAKGAKQMKNEEKMYKSKAIIVSSARSEWQPRNAGLICCECAKKYSRFQSQDIYITIYDNADLDDDLKMTSPDPCGCGCGKMLKPE